MNETGWLRTEYDDCIVVKRADVPAVDPSVDHDGYLIDGEFVILADFGDTPDVVRRWAMRVLALAEYLAAHPPVPPVSDEDVETLAGLLWEYAQNPSGPGDTFAETNEGEHNRFRNRARRLLATGRVSVTK